MKYLSKKYIIAAMVTVDRYFRISGKLVGGHTVEAGFSGEGYSYIIFDGKCIAKKKRLI